MHCRLLHTLLASALVTLVLTLPCTAIGAQDDPAKIDKVRLDFCAAFAAENLKAMDRLIDAGAVWMPPGSPAIVGKEKVIKRYTDETSKATVNLDLKSGPVQVCGDWAFFSAPFTRTETPKAGGPSKTVSGQYLWILKKQPNGSWKVARDIWNIK